MEQAATVASIYSSHFSFGKLGSNLFCSQKQQNFVDLRPLAAAVAATAASSVAVSNLEPNNFTPQIHGYRQSADQAGIILIIVFHFSLNEYITRV